MMKIEVVYENYASPGQIEIQWDKPLPPNQKSLEDWLYDIPGVENVLIRRYSCLVDYAEHIIDAKHLRIHILESDAAGFRKAFEGRSHEDV